jgi:hypothetical protein
MAFSFMSAFTPFVTQKITEITRRNIVDTLLLDSGWPFYGRMDLISFLTRIWKLDQMPSEDRRFANASGDIWQHMVNNSDWNDSELLYRRLNIAHVPDEMFACFLETCVHPLVCPEPDRIASLVALFNGALKNDGFTMQPGNQISGHPIYKLVTMTGAGGIGHEYEIVLSFAGEDRAYVEQVASVLRINHVSVFYDGYEEATLWGKNLTEHLHSVYSGPSRYCVMFISRHYADKVWPSHERRSAFEKAIRTRVEYILPARFDDTVIPGLYTSTVYVDLNTKTPHQLAMLILQKLGRIASHAF